MSASRAPNVLNEIWSYRQLLRSLVVRNLKVKYKRSLLGFLWTLLNPLLTVGVLAVVFTHIVKIPLRHYLAFLFSSYFVWNFMLQTISSGTFLLAEHAQLARSVAFPKEVPVIAGVISHLVEFIIELLLIVVGLIVFHHQSMPASFVLLPYLVLVQYVLALGLVFPIAGLSVFYLDVQHLLPIVMTVLFYISPVFYPASMVPEAMRPYFMGNPIAQLLTVYQAVLYDGAFPSWKILGILTATAVGLLLAGYAVFNRHKHDVAEVI